MSVDTVDNLPGQVMLITRYWRDEADLTYSSLHPPGWCLLGHLEVSHRWEPPLSSQRRYEIHQPPLPFQASVGATEETDEAGQSWAGELWRLSVCKQVWSLQVLVQLMIMHGELDLENMEIQWTTVAREYCQRHFNLDGNYRCSWREIYIWLLYYRQHSGLSWEKWSWQDNIWRKSMKLVNSFAHKINSWSMAQCLNLSYFLYLAVNSFYMAGLMKIRIALLFSVC